MTSKEQYCMHASAFGSDKSSAVRKWCQKLEMSNVNINSRRSARTDYCTCLTMTQSKPVRFPHGCICFASVRNFESLSTLGLNCFWPTFNRSKAIHYSPSRYRQSERQPVRGTKKLKTHIDACHISRKKGARQGYGQPRPR